MELTRFWHRRICEATMFVSGIIIVLYFYVFFNGAQSLNAGLLITSTSVIFSAITFVLSAAFYLWAPKKAILPGALTVYGLLIATTGTLIATTTGIESPFIALWILVAVFAAIFGLYGVVPLFIIGSSYVFLEAINGGITQNTVIITAVAGYLPLVASYIIWHSKNTHENSKDKAFRDLASELSQVANKSEVVINAISDGVLAVDSQGTIQLINPAAQEITGWGKQDATTLSYKSVLKLVDKKDQELTDATDPVQQVLSTNKEVRSSSLSLVTNSGKKLYVSLVVSPVGQVGAGVIIVFRDVTKEKAEEREQAEFISTASHEMRTPVASIEGYLGLALNPATAQIDEKARDFINKAHESSQHLGRLFQDLLDVSKTEDGRLSNNPKVVDVTHFVHDVVEGLRPQAEAKQLRLLFKPEPDNDEKQSDRHLSPVFYAQVDNDHLREVTANLVENAIKYTLKGDVTIDITGDSEKITISIADSGIGIPAEDISHLFQKFYRVDNTDTREIGGTGLGLYLCRRLAEVMGGRISVESEYKKGSTFSLELPRISHEEATRLIETADQAANRDIPIIEPAVIIPQPVAQPSPNVVAPQQIAPQISETITSPPAAQIAQQLQTIATQQTQSPQVVQQQPLNVPSPIQQPNTPLNTIEQNPMQYIQDRPTRVTIPIRGPDQPR